MDISVTLWANAGVALKIGEKGVWIDPFSVQKQPGFSVLSPFLAQKIRRHLSFSGLTACCFTHKHGDHYSAAYTKEARALYPDAAFFLPEQAWGPEFAANVDDLTFRFLRLPHEGAQYADVCHYGILISCQGRNILVSGDCAVAAEELARALQGQKIHLAILNFPWLTLRKGRQFVEEYLKDSQILLVHLPFAEDDTFGYRAAAEKECAAGTFRAQPLMDPLQTIELTI